jgi:phosphate acetyltransferase
MLHLDPNLLQELAREPARVVFGDAVDPKVVAALPTIVAEGFVQPVVVEPVSSAARVDGVEYVSIQQSPWTERCVADYLARSGGRVADTEAARAHLCDPLLFGAVLTRIGGVDAGIAGSMSTSAAVIRAGIVGLGVARAGGLASGCFVMQRGALVLTFADCSVVPDPSSEQLADIAEMTAGIHELVTGDEACVGMLSFSTNGSAKHPKVDKVRTAVELLRLRRPDLRVDGEMQFDVALMSEVAQRKYPASSVSGHANVLIFPDLDAGNIGYKLAERLGGFTAIGSIVMGLRRPWIDLSRGCSTDDVVNAATVSACLSRSHEGRAELPAERVNVGE